MLIERRPATHRWADSDPASFVDVHRQRRPAAGRTPERPYVKRVHASARVRPTLQLTFSTRSSRLWTARSPGLNGGAHDLAAAAESVEAPVTAVASRRSEAANSARRIPNYRQLEQPRAPPRE